MPPDGTFQTDTAKWEKRNIAIEIPVWNPDICIQCNKCAIVCPHATIRAKVYDEKYLSDGSTSGGQGAPSTFKSTNYKGKEFPNMKYTIQIAPEDCTGCGVCVDVCPAKDKKNPIIKAINMELQEPLRKQERENWDFFIKLPEVDRRDVKTNSVKFSQFLQPLFEFSGACAGCGETPYLKLLSQLFGDRAIIANATGCSSIYGGNLPTTPWAKNKDGRGPAWANSLFEDNAEFGFGFRLTIDKQTEYAHELLKKLENKIGTGLVEKIINADQLNETGIYEQRENVKELKKKLEMLSRDVIHHVSTDAKNLLSIADVLIKKTVWIVGGDGWAYDIGYGGLDHILASGKNVNVLVLDTEVYSNTGGQMSKSTNRGAVAKFAANGKQTAKKDLGMMAMSYGSIYVAQIAMGANDTQTIKAFLEAEAYNGPSLIIAYSHCIAHGINMTAGMQNQKSAVESGYWPLYRYNPDLVKEGKNPLILDSKEPSIPFKDYAYMEARYKILQKTNPDLAKQFVEQAQNDVKRKWNFYKQLSSFSVVRNNVDD
jgi:pyruvate-ferredoxin/flavodoxin oxidoreductase